MDRDLRDNKKNAHPKKKHKKHSKSSKSHRHSSSKDKSRDIKQQREDKLNEAGPSGHSSQEGTSIHIIDVSEELDEETEICQETVEISHSVEGGNLFTKLATQQRQTEISKPPHSGILPIGGQVFTPKADTVYLKPLSAHPVSAELQYFYLQLTESIFGYSETKRNECMRTLERDPNMRELAPHLAVFIKETIEKNIVLADISFLIFAVKMVKNLLNNEAVRLQEQLHIILPAVTSCVITRKVCKNYTDNHWTLRDLSALVVSEICKKYNSKTTNLTKRVIEIYLKPLKDTKNHSLTSVYGAVKGLASLGQNTIKNFLLPNIKNISPIIQTAEESIGKYSDEGYRQLLKEAKHVRDAIVNATAPILHAIPIVKFTLETYSDEFGYMGKYIYTEVKNLDLLEDRKRKRKQTAAGRRGRVNPLKKAVFNPKPSSSSSPTSDSSDEDVSIFPESLRPDFTKQYAKRSSTSGSYELSAATHVSSGCVVPTSGPNAPTPSTRRQASFTTTISTKNVSESTSIVSVAPIKIKIPSPISAQSYFSGKLAVQDPFNENSHTQSTCVTDQLGSANYVGAWHENSTTFSINSAQNQPTLIADGTKSLPHYIMKVQHKMMPGCSIPVTNPVQYINTPSTDIQEFDLSSIQANNASAIENNYQLIDPVPPTYSGNSDITPFVEGSSGLTSKQLINYIDPMISGVACQGTYNLIDEPLLSFYPKQQPYFCYRSLCDNISPTHQMYLDYSTDCFDNSLSSLTYNPNEDASTSCFQVIDFDEPSPSGYQDQEISPDKICQTQAEPGPSQPRVPPLRISNLGSIYASCKSQASQEEHPSFISEYTCDPNEALTKYATYKKKHNKENTKKKSKKAKKGKT